ncbi:hypothetical protein B0F90DRAFT_1752811 [Multifurca ochricompacta]|uniref:Uncharacterized protein n=1 Tax=Multifurca ochricompacta TaxID=376703 RepID=A0AAD4M0K5_9AGAM|nr:hypothetical protein B0F90DRAFT_1752811 [Multifurca ochricompacta]
MLSLFRRSKEFKQPEDVKYVIEYLRHLRGLPLDTLKSRTMSLRHRLLRCWLFK